MLNLNRHDHAVESLIKIISPAHRAFPPEQVPSALPESSPASTAWTCSCTRCTVPWSSSSPPPADNTYTCVADTIPETTRTPSLSAAPLTLQSSATSSGLPDWSPLPLGWALPVSVAPHSSPSSEGTFFLTCVHSFWRAVREYSTWRRLWWYSFDSHLWDISSSRWTATDDINSLSVFLLSACSISRWFWQIPWACAVLNPRFYCIVRRGVGCGRGWGLEELYKWLPLINKQYKKYSIIISLLYGNMQCGCTSVILIATKIWLLLSDKLAWCLCICLRTTEIRGVCVIPIVER